MKTKRDLSRRQFLGVSAGLLAAMPGITFAQARARRGNRLRVASVGAGGQAMADLNQIVRVADLVAFADVDYKRAASAHERWPELPGYKDYREMLEKERDNIDAVLVATPDHVHAVAALTAIVMGKHVYVEKPMAHNIAEVRKLMAAAEKFGVVTQMGNQGHSSRGCYELKAALERGDIGEVREVHCWTDRPSWPQGITAPTDTPPVPETLAWDLWLGPAADRPYHPAYCPRNWRGWWDFGCGALGDMGCHILDAPFYALDLGAPARISVEQDGATADTGPKSGIVRFEFPARGDKPPVTLTWYEGGRLIPEDLTEGEEIGTSDGGSLYIGSRGKLHAGCYGMPVKPLPASMPWERPELDWESPRGHQNNWVQACVEGGQALSHFGYAGPLTEIVLLGVIAQRVGEPLEWDAAQSRFTNSEKANQYIARTYREGWELG